MILSLLFFGWDYFIIKKWKITDTFGGQTHASQWDRCRWWGLPPCCWVCVVWTGLLSYGSLHPVLRWGALQDTRHPSHLSERTGATIWPKTKNEKILHTEKHTFSCSDFSSIFAAPLTRISLHVDRLCLGEFQSSDPSLALYFWVGLQVVGLGTSVGNDKIARVFHSNIGCGQVDGASACVTHLCLGPEDKQNEEQSHTEFVNPCFLKEEILFVFFARQLYVCLKWWIQPKVILMYCSFEWPLKAK